MSNGNSNIKASPKEYSREMLSFDEVVRRILSARPDLTMDRIMSMVKLKREIAGRLLTDEGAAYMLARELGVDVTTDMSPTTLKLKDLVTGASDVTVTGKVILTYPTRTFSRKNGALGKVGRFVLQDETATVNVVLWDEKAELLERKKVLPGMVVKVNHGYVRAGLSGRPEVNVGTRGSITALEPPASISLPLQNEQQRKIKDIKPEDVLTDFVGIVSNVFPPSQFTCSDGRV
ncbi:MAG: OB-fold nucleic acid binding domain-containing protein, partial [Candidatus Bathyarchaeia archaeon]